MRALRWRRRAWLARGLGSLPARLPRGPEFSWRAARLSVLLPSGVLGGARRSSLPFARVPPCPGLAQFPAWKSGQEKGHSSQSQARPAGTCSSPPEGEAPRTRGLTIVLLLRQKLGLTFRVSRVEVLGGYFFLFAVCTTME